MSESIKQRVAAMSNSRDKVSLKKLLDAALVDLTEVRAELAKGITDYAAGRAEVVKILTDLTAARAEVVKLVTDVTALITREKSFTLSDAGLTIASGKKTATAAKDFTYIANGTVGYKALGDMSALVGTIADGKSAGWSFYIDSAGTITTSAKTADADNAAAAYALVNAIAQPAGKALIGHLVVSTTGATFIGGTTDLDAGTATDIYMSIIGPAYAPAAITAVAPAAITAVNPAAATATAPADLTLIV